MSSGVVRRYGVYVLAVELLGAVATLLYGVNLVWDPVNEAPEMDPADPALPLVRICMTNFTNCKCVCACACACGLTHGVPVRAPFRSCS